jgi:hypothetical protein
MTHAVAQSPWLQSRAGAFIHLSNSATPTYSQVLDANGEARALPARFSSHTTQLYGEYGIHPRITLAATLPYTRITRQINGRAISHGGMSNLVFAVRGQVLRGNWPLTFTLRLDAPVRTRLAHQAEALVLGYPATTFLPMISSGQRFFNTYWSAYAGYGFRSDAYSDFAQFGVESGCRIRDWWVAVFSDYVYSSENKTPQLIDFQNNYAFFTNNQSWWTLGLKARVELNRFFGVTGQFTPVLVGQSVTRQPSVGIGGYFKWE